MLARGSSLGAIKVDGQAQAGRKVIGAELVGTDADGVETRVRIDDVQRSPKGDRDLLHYQVSTYQAGAWGPLCEGQPAIALPGSAEQQ